MFTFDNILFVSDQILQFNNKEMRDQAGDEQGFKSRRVAGVLEVGVGTETFVKPGTGNNKHRRGFVKWYKNNNQKY